MKVVKKIIIILVVIAFFALAVGMSLLLLNTNDYNVSQFGDTALITINDEISSPKYDEGDLVLVKHKNIEDINPGDELFIYKIQDDKSVKIELGLVSEVYADKNAVTIENGGTYSSKFLAGEADEVYESVGKLINVLSSRWIFFFAIVVPCFLIFIYQIYALIIEIKYGDKE